MSDHQQSLDNSSYSTSHPPHPVLQSALGQIKETSRLYNEAVGSYNTHLDNHRERRNLYDLPFRAPITAHDAFDDAIEGDPDSIEALLEHLLDQPHLDSQLRRHPRTYPIHIEAVEHLQLAREQLVTVLEEAFQHTQTNEF